MTTAQIIADALKALTPETGFHKPHQQQTTEATARGVIAIASALDDIAASLNDIASALNDDTTPPGITVRPAIHHSS